MNAHSVAELIDGTTFTNHVFLDESFQLLDSAVPFTNAIKKALAEWGFAVVYSDGNAKPPEPETPEAESAAEPQDTEKKDIPQNVSYEAIDINDLLGLPQQPKEEKPELPKSPPPPPPPDVGSIDDLFGSLDDPFVESPQEEAESISETKKEDYSRTDNVKQVYDTYLDYVDELYTKYATHKVLNYQEIAEKVKELCIFIKENQRFVLRIMPSEREREHNFLISHSMRSTALAITIGLALHLSLTKLVDLGVTCILHEIGQIRLPPQLYMTDRLLTASEKAQMEKHPVISYNILKQHDFPLSVQLGALDHHERENGSGYPRHVKGDKITAFAKIISVACSFEAISAPREFREERTTYEAMIEMLQNHDHAYDENVIKALLSCLSLFPIGAYVRLANGKVAQVIDVTPGEPKHPLVQLIDEVDEQGNQKTLKTDSARLKIVSVLNKQEVAQLKNTAE